MQETLSENIRSSNSTRSIPLGINAVTEIQEFANDYAQIATLENTETHTDNVSADTGHVERCHVWIPWADSQGDFQKSHVAVTLTNGGPVYFIWQSHGLVRYSKGGFQPDGPAVPGYSGEGGRRRLHVLSNGQIELREMT